MRVRRARPRAGALAVVLMLAAALVACGGGSSEQPRSSTQAAGIATPTPTSTSAGAAGSVVKVQERGSFGQMLTDASGFTLYIFTRDDPGSGKSNCTGACAQAWPPLTTSSATLTTPSGLPEMLSTIKRDDGSMQVAYGGRPLYRFASDQSTTDTKGQGVNGVWFVAMVRQSGAAPAASATAAPRTTPSSPTSGGNSPY